MITRYDDQVLCAMKCGEGMTHDEWGNCHPCSSTDYFEPLSESSCVQDCQSTPYPRMVIEDDPWSYCVRRNCPSGSVLTSNGQCVSCDVDAPLELYNPGECETTCRGKRQSYTDGNDYTTCRKICGNNQYYSGGYCTNCDALESYADNPSDCASKCSNRYSKTLNGSSGCPLNSCPTGYFRTSWDWSRESCVSCDVQRDVGVSSESACNKCANEGAHVRTYTASPYYSDTSRGTSGYCKY